MGKNRILDNTLTTPTTHHCTLDILQLEGYWQFVTLVPNVLMMSGWKNCTASQTISKFSTKQIKSPTIATTAVLQYRVTEMDDSTLHNMVLLDGYLLLGAHRHYNIVY